MLTGVPPQYVVVVLLAADVVVVEAAVSPSGTQVPFVSALESQFSRPFVEPSAATSIHPLATLDEP